LGAGGLGPPPQSPIPNPQSPIPNPQSEKAKIKIFYKNKIIIKFINFVIRKIIKYQK
jgi:hypothetical protein